MFYFCAIFPWLNVSYLIFRQCVLSNFLTTLLRPNFAKPVETVEDLVNSDFLVYEIPGGEYWQQLYAASPKESYRQMANLFFFAKNDEDFNNYTIQMAEKGGLAQVASTMGPDEISWGRNNHPQGRGFYQSKEKISEKKHFTQIK